MMKGVLVFGIFQDRWAWRVEWMEDGVLRTKDFFQKDLQPGAAKLEASYFCEFLEEVKVA